jgi:hypothetical protein
MTTLYLAIPPGILMDDTAHNFKSEPAPALLVSFAHWERFEAHRNRLLFRRYCLDSGAFTVFHAGASISLDDYIAFCKQRKAEPHPPAEVFSLDVIGDWRASLRNTEAMWRAGIEAIPAYHYGEPADVLAGLARDYPKVALGGTVGTLSGPGKFGMRKTRDRWFEQCMARIWPKRVHAFGMTTESLLMRFPFHSVDSSTWRFGPNHFGRWLAYGKRGRQGRVKTENRLRYLRPEIDYYLDLERRVTAKWRKELAKL